MRSGAENIFLLIFLVIYHFVFIFLYFIRKDRDKKQNEVCYSIASYAKKCIHAQ